MPADAPPPAPVGAGPVRRTRTVAVRLTEAEEAAWIAAALKAGRRQLGAWAREEIAAAIAAGSPARRRAAEPRLPDGLAGLRGELGQLAGNLNQMARVAHTPGHPHAGMLAPALERMLPELLAAVAAMREAIEDLEAGRGRT